MKVTQNHVAEKVKEVMELLMIKPDENNVETPKRVAKMWLEMFSSLYQDEEEFKKSLTLFPAPSRKENITVRDIPFHSMCAHHWLPFMGKVSVTYTPDKKIIGLSKIPRIVKFCSRKPQVQENLTLDIVNMLRDILDPDYIEVKLYDVTHTCVTCRGVESFAETDTQFDYKKWKGCI